MKILTASQIRLVDSITIDKEPINSIDLMERAAKHCVEWIINRFDKNLKLQIFIGPGNNGGDGLAIARLLDNYAQKVEVYMLTSVDKLSVDCSINYKLLKTSEIVKIFFLEEGKKLPQIQHNDIVIDAMFGYGLSRPLNGIAEAVVKHINSSAATVIAIDIPTGLFSELNTYNAPDAIVKANFTITFQLPKLSFFFAENEMYVGEWHVININLLAEAIDKQQSEYNYLETCDIVPLLKKRNIFAHKGTYGHALLLAGSYGKMGAAVLASKACLKSGVGLLTTRIPQKGYDIMQTSVPEAMVSVDPTQEHLSSIPNVTGFSAIGIGPGLGTNDYCGLVIKQLMQNARVPLVIDADGLNLIAKNAELLKNLPVDTILTPHPGEFDRLAGVSLNGYERNRKQIEFSMQYKVIVVLKGAFTSITSPQGYCWFNSTGNAGMATAGSGDVLTGIILSLLAQGYKPIQAAQIGVFLHGLAADIAICDIGEESLIASDIIKYIGKAFLKLKERF